jgi:hypothetical protein
VEEKQSTEHRLTELESQSKQSSDIDIPTIYAELRAVREDLKKLFYTLLGIGGALVLGLVLSKILGG